MSGEIYGFPIRVASTEQLREVEARHDVRYATDATDSNLSWVKYAVADDCMYVLDSGFVAANPNQPQPETEGE